jgi:DeoR family glycerol-3-phosphate regulon repressor
MHEGAGFTTPNLREAEINRAFVTAANELVVLADHTKWGVTGLTTMARLDDADVCVTDELISEQAREVLSDHVGRLVVSSTKTLPVDRSA